MSRHRRDPVRRAAGRRRAARAARTRVRERLTVAAGSCGLTALVVLVGLGAVPAGPQPAAGAADAVAGTVTSPPRATVEPPAGSSLGPTAVPPRRSTWRVGAGVPADALPARSGSGRRVVFSESAQRVWLVTGQDRVLRTYLVSGSVHDNLDPGTYAVFSRSERAWGIDDSGTMRWFVRFAHGPNAAIGFHDIPVDRGGPVQTLAQLGTPLSHGCVRQRAADAKALWDFASLGTTVVVVG